MRETFLSQRLGYSIGFTLSHDFERVLALSPDRAWSPAYDADGDPVEFAQVAEVTGLLDLSGWPPETRVIIRRERPHRGDAAADHRHRREPDHRLRHQHPPRAAGRPRGMQ